MSENKDAEYLGFDDGPLTFQQKRYKKLIKKAPTPEDIAMALDGDTLYLVIIRNGKPLVKIDWHLAMDAGDDFMQMMRSNHELSSNQEC